jgi:hypothetical protein
MTIETKREKIRNVPSIEELRKAGYKVSVRHFRRYTDEFCTTYMTKTLFRNAYDYTSEIPYSNLFKISSHGGWTVLDVRTLTGREISVKYNVPAGHQFNRKVALRACLGKLIKELGNE